MSEPETFGCFIPTAMHDDPPAWQGYWEQAVRAHGGEPAGTPTIEPYTQIIDGVESTAWAAYGPAIRGAAPRWTEWSDESA